MEIKGFGISKVQGEQDRKNKTCTQQNEVQVQSSNISNYSQKDSDKHFLLTNSKVQKQDLCQTEATDQTKNNSLSSTGENQLHVAIKQKDLQQCILLLSRQVDYNKVNNDFQSPLDLAREVSDDFYEKFLQVISEDKKIDGQYNHKESNSIKPGENLSHQQASCKPNSVQSAEQIDTHKKQNNQNIDKPKASKSNFKLTLLGSLRFFVSQLMLLLGVLKVMKAQQQNDPDLSGGTILDVDQIINYEVYSTILLIVQLILIFTIAYLHTIKSKDIGNQAKVLNINNIWEIATYLLQILPDTSLDNVNTAYYCQLALCYILLQVNVVYLVSFIDLLSTQEDRYELMWHNSRQQRIKYTQYMFQQSQMTFWQLIQFIVLVLINFIQQIYQIPRDIVNKENGYQYFLLFVDIVFVSLVVLSVGYKLVFTLKLQKGFSQWDFYADRSLASKPRNYYFSILINKIALVIGFVGLLLLIVLLFLQHVTGLYWDQNVSQFYDVMKRCNLAGSEYRDFALEYLDTSQDIYSFSKLQYPGINSSLDSLNDYNSQFVYNDQNYYIYNYQLDELEARFQYTQILNQSQFFVFKKIGLDMGTENKLVLPNITFSKANSEPQQITYANIQDTNQIRTGILLNKLNAVTLKKNDSDQWVNTSVIFPNDQTGDMNFDPEEQDQTNSSITTLNASTENRDRHQVLYEERTDFKTLSSYNKRINQGIFKSQNQKYSKYTLLNLLPYASTDSPARRIFLNAENPYLINDDNYNEAINNRFLVNTIICGGLDCYTNRDILKSLALYARDYSIYGPEVFSYTAYILPNHKVIGQQNGDDTFISIIQLMSNQKYFNESKGYADKIRSEDFSNRYIFDPDLEEIDHSIKQCYNQYHPYNFFYFYFGPIQYAGKWIFKLAQVICWPIILGFIIQGIVKRQTYYNSFLEASQKNVELPSLSYQF